MIVSLSDRPSSRASPLPHLIGVNTDFVFTKIYCGSGLAREGTGTGNTKKQAKKGPEVLTPGPFALQ
ncbi:hypothetical protein C5612_04480 [Pseudomonas frederiksbergensis]|uniref:Uncharacterized protein n=1 Tax=Pseudomonas frederiksbergensis TaxID=104087 RepID=A0A2S8HTK7_9PSED|nr:hypothetical protein C5612_04480 [Pseudomonas frederiksbergensis]